MAATNRNGRRQSARAAIGTHDNLADVSTLARRAVHEVWQAATALHGHPTYTRAKAAAHDAGHMIVGVASASGVLPVGANIAIARDHEGDWIGVAVHGDLVPVATAADVFPAVHRAAGVAGEILAGLAHPASGLDETVPAGLHLVGLSALRRGNHYAAIDPRALAPAMHAVTQAALRILEANRPQWEAVRRGLMKRETLGYPALLKRLGGLVLPDDWRDGVDEFLEADDAQLAALAAGGLA